MARNPLTVTIDWDDDGSFETSEIVPKADLLGVSVFYGCDTVSDVTAVRLASAMGRLTLNNFDRKYSPGVSTVYSIAQLTRRHLCRISHGTETVWEGFVQAPEFTIDRAINEVTFALVGKIVANLPSNAATQYRLRLSNFGVDRTSAELLADWRSDFPDVPAGVDLFVDYSTGAISYEDNAVGFINELAEFEGGFAYETFDGKLELLGESRLAGTTPQVVSPMDVTMIHPTGDKPDLGRLYNRVVIHSTQAARGSEQVLLRIGGVRVPANAALGDTYFVDESASDPVYTIDWTTIPNPLTEADVIQHRANATDTYGPSTRVHGNLAAEIITSGANRVEILINNTENFEKYIELLIVQGRATRNLPDVSQRTYSDSAGIAAHGLRELQNRPFLDWFRKTGLGAFTTRATRMATLRDHLLLTFPLWQGQQGQVDDIHDIQPGAFLQLTLDGVIRSVIALGVTLADTWDGVPKKTVYCRQTDDHTTATGNFTLGVSVLDGADVLG